MVETVISMETDLVNDQLMETGENELIDTSQNASFEELMSKIKPSSFGMKRNYSTIDISADKWLLTMDPKSLEKLANPPSLADGLERETEQDLRYLGCELIQAGSILLKLPQTASATGQILYQRFYYQRSFVRCNFEHHLMACLLLASKIEEAPRRPRDVINVYHRLKQLHRRRHSSNPTAKLDISILNGDHFVLIVSEWLRLEPLLLDAKYSLLKNNVIKAERRILNTLGFVVHVHHPHKLIYAYLHTLQCIDNKELLQRAWSYMNDGLRTDIFLRYKPETIACACIYLAARTIENPIPLPKEPYPWYELYDASDRDVKTISEILMRLYERTKPPSWSKLVSIIDKLHMEHFKPELIQEPPPGKPKVEESKRTPSKKENLANGNSRDSLKGRYERRRHDESSLDDRSRNRSRDRDRYRDKDRYRDELPVRQRSPYRKSHERSVSIEKYRRGGLDERNGKYRKDDRERERSYSKLDRDYKDSKREKKEKDRRRDRSRSRSRSRDRKKEKERDRLDQSSKQREREIRRALGKRGSSRSPSPISIKNKR